jgi:glyoxylase-like metal-dependent hydrolase (beta-lactamase superfamily II)
MPVQKLLQGIAPQQTQRDLRAAFVPQPYEMNFNAFLINTGHKLLLIDTGAGHFLGKSLGNLVRNLEASGYRPDQVDEIDITHAHPDHIGGLSASGKRVFPNAVVRINQRDVDYWLNRGNMDKAPSDDKALFVDARSALQPYVDADRLKPFNGSVELEPGIRSIALYGHTPGHTGYLIQSEGKTMLVWGDVVHVPAVQFADLAVTIDFDWNANEARASRERILAEAASNGWLVAGEHIAFPGLGHVVKNGSGYRWLPLAYRETH